METFAGSEAVVTAITGIAEQITSTVGSIAPAAVGVTGLFLVWKCGIRFFKGLAK